MMNNKTRFNLVKSLFLVMFAALALPAVSSPSATPR